MHRRSLYLQLLKYHVLPTPVNTANMTEGQHLKTKLQGRTITVGALTPQVSHADSAHAAPSDRPPSLQQQQVRRKFGPHTDMKQSAAPHSLSRDPVPIPIDLI